MECKRYATLDALDTSAYDLILTVNQRLARRVTEQADKQAIHSGKQSWNTVPALAISTWIIQTWQQYANPSHTLLSTAQERSIWLKIIRTFAQEQPLLQPEATASLAMSGRQLLQQWEIPLTDLKHHPNQEAAVFYEWASAFDAYCEAHQFITQTAIPGLLAKTDLSNCLTSTTKILLMGFDDFSPALMTLFDSLQAHAHLTQANIVTPKPKHYRVTCEDLSRELEDMVDWAYTLYLQHPDYKIGCVVPTLSSQRRTVYNAFHRRFQPHSKLPGQYSMHKYFNLSAGQPLAEFSLVQSAVNLLAWLTNKIDIETFHQIAQSPYFYQDTNEQNLLALIDLSLRDLDATTLPFETIFSVTEKLNISQPENTLIYRLQAFNQARKKLPRYAAPSIWATHFMDTLKQLGWPGARVLNSEEYQLLTHLKSLFSSLKSLDPILEKISVSNALNTLKDFIQNTQFQTEGSLARLQVLGVLEASGNDFDALWVMGLTDDVWPQPAKPHPFIPFDIQREHQMPHATAEREAAFTLHMMNRLKHSAKIVYFSAAKLNGDQLLTPSRYIQDFPSTNLAETKTNLAPSISEQVLHCAKLENTEDTHAYPIKPNEKIPGGSWILKAQSQCPFKAFALARLKAITPTKPQTGISPLLRGSLTHDILDRLWQSLKTQSKLNTLTIDQREQFVSDTVEAVLNNADQQLYNPLNKTFLEIEKKRLKNIIIKWLDVEKNRQPFTVLSTEKSFEIHFRVLKIRLRIDRIDQDEDGNQLIIDYKTSNNTLSDWFGERPFDPQLPLYAACIQPADTHTFLGIGFAELTPKKFTYKGLYSELIDNPGIGFKPINKLIDQQTWALQLATWKDTMERLANEFSDGYAPVQPSNTSRSCTYCDCRSLCRIE